MMYLAKFNRLISRSLNVRCKRAAEALIGKTGCNGAPCVSLQEKFRGFVQVATRTCRPTVNPSL